MFRSKLDLRIFRWLRVANDPTAVDIARPTGIKAQDCKETGYFHKAEGP